MQDAVVHGGAVHEPAAPAPIVTRPVCNVCSKGAGAVPPAGQDMLSMLHPAAPHITTKLVDLFAHLAAAALKLPPILRTKKVVHN